MHIITLHSSYLMKLKSKYKMHIITFKGVFKGGRFRGCNPPPPNFQIFFKSKGKEVERKIKKNEKGWGGGGGG